MIVEDQLKWWVEYFSSIFNRDDLCNLFCFEINIFELDINLDVIIRNEVCQVIQLLKNNKVFGYDDILVELLKVDIEIVIEVFFILFEYIW